MLTQVTAMLPFTSDVVALALAKPSHPWSIRLNGGGSELMARVGVKLAGIPVYKQVKLEIGSSPDLLHDGRVMLPVSWATAGGPPIFPKLAGTIHVEPAGQTETRVTLNATYDPPLGKLGALLDRALMHRLAMMTMVDFVDRIVLALTEELSPALPPSA